jgi:hypothetical protein
MEIPEIIDTLEATPRWLSAACEGKAEEVLRRRPRAREWSAAELLAHLRASNAILAPRVYQVLTRSHAPLTGFDERLWAQVAARARLAVKTQLAAFEAQRAELVALLRTLTPQEWEADGLHETRGPLTVQAIVAEIAEHEREHEAQMRAIVAAQLPRVVARASNRSRPRKGARSSRRSPQP